MSNKITIDIEGVDKEQGHLQLRAFSGMLQSLSGILNKIDSLVGNGKRNTRFRITELSHNSPAHIVVEAVSESQNEIQAKDVVMYFASSIKRIGDGGIPDSRDYIFLEDLRDITKQLGKNAKKISISANDDVIDINDAFHTELTKALSEEDRCIGSIEGVLEKVNVHDGANVFTIFPSVGAPKVTCKVPPELVEKAISGTRHQVEVTGLLKYRKSVPYPYAIDVEGIEIYLDDDQLPSAYDLLGISPDATSGLSSEDFIRLIREEWDDDTVG